MTRQKIVILIVLSGGLLWGLSLIIARVLVPESNPAPQYAGPILGAQADPILRKSCYDCHSHETQWPWYSHLPVIAVWVAQDVAKGRRELNFSTWDTLNPTKQQRKLKKSLKEIAEGEMPLVTYTFTHPQAVVTPEELRILRQGAQSQGKVAGLQTEGKNAPLLKKSEAQEKENEDTEEDES